MNQTIATPRAAAALMSLTVTLFVLNAVASYAHPRQADAQTLIASHTAVVLTVASK